MPGTIRPRPTRMPFLLLVLALLASVPTSPVAAQTASERDDPTTGISQTSTPQTDHGIEDRLRGIFAEMEPLENIEVTVSAGVVELGGEVDSMATASRALRLAGQVDGVVDVQDSLVVNRDLDSRIESTRQTLTEAGEEILSALPLLVAALGVFILFWLLGAWLGRRQRLFGRVTPNVFIAGLLGQATHLLFVVMGLVVALVLLDATAILGTILGAAGIVGLAIGFAVRDTVENYIASILLSLRNPFSVNDLVEVDGQLGNVVTLTSRATILLSPEGNHVRIPNATVFKAVIINYTRRPERRFEFDVGIGSDHDLRVAQQIALEALEALPGILDDPPTLVIIEGLGDSTVALRCYGWVDQRRYDFVKVRSEAIRRVKDAFDQAGISMPEPSYRLRIVERATAKDTGVRTPGPNAPQHADTAPPPTTEVTDISVDRAIEERVLSDARSDRGNNLLSGDADKEL